MQSAECGIAAPHSAFRTPHFDFAVSPLSATLPGQGCLSQPCPQFGPAAERKEVLMAGQHSGQHFRFLHAGDFALDVPLTAVPGAPASLRELLIDAPYLAAERVFGAAIEERVDFLVLSG